MSEQAPRILPDVPDSVKIAAIEHHYKACWPCIQVQVQHHCQHYKERIESERLEQSRINPTAFLATIEANRLAFRDPSMIEPSPIEAQLLSAFWRAGLDPVQQYGIAGYVVDFAFPRARLVIEADGAEYHKDDERERRRDEAIRQQGWHIIHFTGREIYQDADGCVATCYRLARSSLV